MKMKTFLTFVLFVSFCSSSAFAIADDEPSAAREIVRGINEARTVRTSVFANYLVRIIAIDTEMTATDHNSRPFQLGLYYEAWLHVRDVDGMDNATVQFYNRFRNIQFELRLSDRQLAKLAHHHERKFAYAPRR